MVTTATVIGLGEAGALYARGLRDAGFTVLGYDPFTTIREPGIVQTAALTEAVTQSDLVISLVGAVAAERVSQDSLPTMKRSAVYADFNTAAPTLKADMGLNALRLGVAFADVAVLAPVPRAGIKTPLMASGPGADRFAEMIRPAGADVQSIQGAAGDAAARKLLRSVFMKGLAAVVLESIGAAHAAGQEAWLRGQIETELSSDPHDLVNRLIVGSRQHAERRVHETKDAADYLTSLNQPRWTTDAAHSWLSSLRSPQSIQQHP